MDKLISVIVPVYNVYKYVDKCIESIINQSYKNLDIILVDDGSTDGSGDICENYKNKDKRISVIHKKNGGLSDARNFGLKYAKGEYLTLVDADDLIRSDMIEGLLKAAIENNADISLGNFEKCSLEYGLEKLNNIKKDFLLDVKLLPREYLTGNKFDISNHTLITVAWCKLYKKHLFENIVFPYGKLHEDEFTTYKLLDKSNKIIFVDEPYYFYVQREDSIMSKKFNKKRMDLLDACIQKMEDYIKENKFEKYTNSFLGYRTFILHLMKMIDESEDYSLKEMKKYIKYYRKTYLENRKKIKLGKVENIKSIIFFLDPYLYYLHFRYKIKNRK